MSGNDNVRSLLRQLRRDPWRDRHGFSESVCAAHNVLFHPFATKAEKQEALALWLQGKDNQPCLFGRIAAASNSLHFCIVDDDDLRESDEVIAGVVQTERLAWKRRSLNPARAGVAPAHGFVVVIASQRIALAEPDETLYRLACQLQDLLRCETTQEEHGTVVWEHLFLQNPQTEECVRFTFSVDFFGSAGDGRWWQDHRIPGGFAFTANSVGHMRRYREWYKEMANQREWVLKTAMETIAYAADTPFGRATWLRELSGGPPFVADVPCPFASPADVKESLKGRDWTRYGGHLHVDHAVRREFFERDPGKPKDVVGHEWLQDFQYLYDEERKDHLRFVQGAAVTMEEVEGELGKLVDYVSLSGTHRRKTARRDEALAIGGDIRRTEVAELLGECRKWALGDAELRELSGAE